jgi:hypothetical protein
MRQILLLLHLVVKNWVYYNYSVEYSPIDSSLLTLLEAAQDFFDYDDDEFEVTHHQISHYMVGDLVCDTLVVGTNGQSNFTKTGGVNMAYDVTNCCDGGDDSTYFKTQPNGVTLKFLIMMEYYLNYILA